MKRNYANPGIIYEYTVTPQTTSGAPSGIEYVKFPEIKDLSSAEDRKKLIEHYEAFPTDAPHYEDAQFELKKLRERNAVAQVGLEVGNGQTKQMAQAMVRSDDASAYEVQEEKLNPVVIAEKLRGTYGEEIKRFDDILYFYNGVNYISSLDSFQAEKIIFNKAYKEIRDIGSPDAVKSIVKALDLSNQIPDSERNKNMVAFNDFDYDCSTGVFTCHDAGHNVVSRINLNYIDWQKGTRKFDCFLANYFGDAEMVARVYEIIGYLLSPDIPRRKFVFLYGPPGTGKSSFANFVASFLPEKNISATPFKELGKKFFGSTLTGKQINIDGDFPREKLSAASIAQMKALTGGDKAFVEAKYKLAVPVQLYVKMVICSNHPLILPSDDPAFIDRILLLPMDKSVAAGEMRLDFYSQFENERAAIAVKALKAYQAVKIRKMVFSGEHLLISYLPEILHIEADKIEFEDYALGFAEEFLEYTGCADDYVASAVLAQKFNEYIRQKIKFEKDISTARVSSLLNKALGTKSDTIREGKKTKKAIRKIKLISN